MKVLLAVLGVMVAGCGGAPFELVSGESPTNGDGNNVNAVSLGDGGPSAQNRNDSGAVSLGDSASSGKSNNAVSAGDGGPNGQPGNDANTPSPLMDGGDSGSDAAKEDASDASDAVVAECAVGTTRCSGTSVQACVSGAWTTTATCPYACQTSDGEAACGGVCAPGQVVCAGQQPELCNSDGTWQPNGAECPAATSVCGAGSCMACTCGSGASCFYSVSEPPVGSGAPYPVTLVYLTPSSPTAAVTATVTSPPNNEHNAVWFDLDVAAFPKGGTITIAGRMGASGTDGTAFLVTECAEFPASGGNYQAAENVGNVPAGTDWSFSGYAFAAGTSLLHFGTEGSWGPAAACPTCVAGLTNTNAVTFSVQGN